MEYCFHLRINFCCFFRCCRILFFLLETVFRFGHRGTDTEEQKSAACAAQLWPVVFLLMCLLAVLPVRSTPIRWNAFKNIWYTIASATNEVMHFECVDGEWKCLQTLSTLPDDFTGKSSVAAVRKFKNYLFVSNRGYHSACRFLIGKDGSLSGKTIIPVSGNFPRDIWPLEKSSLLAANQLGHTVELIENGKTTDEIEVGGAICVIPL